MPTLAIDGNMKLNNMPMRNPDGDVSLSDGEAMFAGSQEFSKHLANVATLPVVSPLHLFPLPLGRGLKGPLI